MSEIRQHALPTFHIGRIVNRVISQGRLVDMLKGRGMYLKAIRAASANYVSKPAVRHYIFTRDEYRCKMCGAKDNLTVDHIVSVLLCSHGEITIHDLNAESNLQTLCGSCNSSKHH